MLTDNAGAYWPDPADEIDQPDEIIADQFGVSLKQAGEIIKMIDRAKTRHLATSLGGMIGYLLMGGNPRARIYGLAFASGLDQLNGLKSQSEAARELGVTRALLSHYVVACRDALDINITKFRKSDKARDTYANIQKKDSSWNRKKH